MIQKNTVLSVIDNSGAQRARCIHVYGGYRRRYARVGDVILVSLIAVRPRKHKVEKQKADKQEIKKGGVCKAVILRTKLSRYFKNGRELSFKENCVAILNNKNRYSGTRVFGIVPLLLRKTKYLRLIKMSSGVVY